MAQMTLTYFDLAASRGEECRLALHLAGVPWKDERLKSSEIAARKQGFPFGALPMLTVEGHAPLAQTNVILRFVGAAYGLHPTEPWAAAYEEAIMESIEDLRHKTNPVRHIKDEAEKKRVREELAEGFLQEWAARLEKELTRLSDGPFVSGKDIHVADLKIFVALTPYMKGSIDYVRPDVFAKYPRLVGVYEAVKAHPKIQAWYAKVS